MGWTRTSPAHAALLTAPWTPRDEAVCAVFRHLWDKGYHLTSGFKFGADFLVYSGRPGKVHSRYTVRVIATPPPGAADVVSVPTAAATRVAHGASKAHLVAYVGHSGVPVYVLAPVPAGIKGKK